jgi:hypothetical protein
MRNDEYIFVTKLIQQFRSDFDVFTEVKSKCRTSRIDLVLLYQKKFLFGIECKIPDKKKGNEIFQYVNQAKRYTEMKWELNNQFFTMPILLCPPLSYNYFIMNECEQQIDNELWHKDRHNKKHDHHSFNGFLGGFNIGEVRKINAGYQFAMNNKPLFKKIQYANGNGWVGVYEDNYASHMAKIKEYDSAI